MFTLSIYSKEAGIHPAFVKANQHIIEKYKKPLKSTNNISNTKKFECLKKLWVKDFNVIISNDWKTLTFNSENHKNLFLIQWS